MVEPSLEELEELYSQREYEEPYVIETPELKYKGAFTQKRNNFGVKNGEHCALNHNFETDNFAETEKRIRFHRLMTKQELRKTTFGQRARENMLKEIDDKSTQLQRCAKNGSNGLSRMIAEDFVTMRNLAQNRIKQDAENLLTLSLQTDQEAAEYRIKPLTASNRLDSLNFFATKMPPLSETLDKNNKKVSKHVTRMFGIQTTERIELGEFLEQKEREILLDKRQKSFASTQALSRRARTVSTAAATSSIKSVERGNSNSLKQSNGGNFSMENMHRDAQTAEKQETKEEREELKLLRKLRTTGTDLTEGRVNISRMELTSKLMESYKDNEYKVSSIAYMAPELNDREYYRGLQSFVTGRGGFALTGNSLLNAEQSSPARRNSSPDFAQIQEVVKRTEEQLSPTLVEKVKSATSQRHRSVLLLNHRQHYLHLKNFYDDESQRDLLNRMDSSRPFGGGGVGRKASSIMENSSSLGNSEDDDDDNDDDNDNDYLEDQVDEYRESPKTPRSSNFKAKANLQKIVQNRQEQSLQRDYVVGQKIRHLNFKGRPESEFFKTHEDHKKKKDYQSMVQNIYSHCRDDTAHTRSLEQDINVKKKAARGLFTKLSDIVNGVKVREDDTAAAAATTTIDKDD